MDYDEWKTRNLDKPVSKIEPYNGRISVKHCGCKRPRWWMGYGWPVCVSCAGWMAGSAGAVQ